MDSVLPRKEHGNYSGDRNLEETSISLSRKMDHSHAQETELSVDASATSRTVAKLRVKPEPPDEDSKKAIEMYQAIAKTDSAELLQHVCFCINLRHTVYFLPYGKTFAQGLSKFRKCSSGRTAAVAIIASFVIKLVNPFGHMGCSYISGS